MAKLVLMAWLVVGLLNCGQEVKMVTLELDVLELRCVDGLRIFESRILDLKGIKSVTVNINQHLAEIEFRDSEMSKEGILEHLSQYGFTVNGKPGNTAARGRLPSCCLTE